MSPGCQIEDYRWLVSGEAGRWLAWAEENSRSLVAQTRQLRKALPAARAHLVLEQVELRRRAREKFPQASRMFFTRLALQQATDQFVAAYKASRFPAGLPVVDLCCGIGGDLLGLAGRGPAVGVDRDPIMVLLAEANAAAVPRIGAQSGSIELRQADAAQLAPTEFLAWHLDPDRRHHGYRTTRIEHYEPGPAVIDRWLDASVCGAVKLAPAAAVPEAWSQRAELEWISRDGECRQLVAWFGPLTSQPGRRRATIVSGHPDRPLCVRTLVGAGGSPGAAGRVGRYVLEPDAAVLAAKLVGPLAAEHDLAPLEPGVGYLTGDRPVVDPALACFEVTDVMPFDLRRLRRLLRSRGVGALEIKKRATRLDPAQIRRQLDLRGDGTAVLLIAPVAGKVTAILARRGCWA